jgi:inorganic triphosphatase YgiF
MSQSPHRAGQDDASHDTPNAAHHDADDRSAAPEPIAAPDMRPSSQAAMPNAEIELKLLCDPEQLIELSHSAVVSRYARDGGTQADLTNIYYDTPDHVLQGLGAVLRVRSDGKRFVMTLKMSDRDHGKPLERIEWNIPVSSMQPEHAALSPILPKALFEKIGNAPLNPVFSTLVRRETRILGTPLGTVELAMDRGRIVAGDRSREISEIELELVDGRTEAIFLLAQELMADAALRPTIYSKSAAGFDLALDNPPHIAVAPKPALDGRATLDQVVERILHAAYLHLLESQPAAEDGRNPEGIHQFRIALRRLRSVLGLMQSMAPSPQMDAIAKEAKWLLSGLSDARDWAVFLTETLPAIAGACPSIDGFDALRGVAEGHRSKAHAAARAAITDPRTGRFQIALGLWIERKGWRAGLSQKERSVLMAPARGLAAQALAALHRKALKRGRHFKTLSPEQRHRLRIAIKKLRYAADFLLPLIGKGKGRRRYADRLARLQDHLGRSNDLAVMERLVRQVMTGAVPVAVHDAAGALLGWQAAIVSRDDAELRAAWKSFKDSDSP